MTMMRVLSRTRAMIRTRLPRPRRTRQLSRLPLPVLFQIGSRSSLMRRSSSRQSVEKMTAYPLSTVMPKLSGFRSRTHSFASRTTLSRSHHRNSTKLHFSYGILRHCYLSATGSSARSAIFLVSLVTAFWPDHAVASTSIGLFGSLAIATDAQLASIQNHTKTL